MLAHDRLCQKIAFRIFFRLQFLNLPSKVKIKLIFKIVNHVTTTWKIAELLEISLGLTQMCNLAEIQD